MAVSTGTTVEQGAQPGAAAPARRRAKGGGRRSSAVVAYLFLAPYLVLFFGFIVAPAIFGIWISLHDYDFALLDKPWVGFANYVELFTPGSRDFGNFWQSMGATGIFTVFTVPCLVIIPLLVALLLNRNFKGRTFFRAVFFLPYVLGVADVGLLSRYIIDPNIGVANALIGS